MSQAIINTPELPTGGIASPLKSGWTAVIAGVVIAGFLGYGAALVATGHLPWIDHQVETPLAAEATPAARSGVVSSGVVDPFEAQVATAAAQAVVGVVDGTSREAVTQSALNPFELRTASLGSSSAAASGGSLAHGVLDPFELRSDTEHRPNTGSPATPRSGTDYPRQAFE